MLIHQSRDLAAIPLRLIDIGSRPMDWRGAVGLEPRNGKLLSWVAALPIWRIAVASSALTAGQPRDGYPNRRLGLSEHEYTGFPDAAILKTKGFGSPQEDPSTIDTAFFRSQPLFCIAEQSR